MDLKKIIKVLTPHLGAILVFLVMSLVYCLPLLEGKVPQQTDVVQAQGMASEILEYYNAGEQVPLWTNSMFSGMPGYQIWMPTPLALITYPFHAMKMGLPSPAAYIFLLLICGYFFMLMINAPRLLCYIGAIAFAFSSYNIIVIEAGHLSKAYTIAYMPCIIGGLLLLFHRKYLLGLAIMAFFTALEFRGNHVQMTYYLIMALLVITLFQLYQSFKKKEMAHFTKAASLALLAGVLGVMSNTSLIWTTYEYANETIRGKKSELVVDPNEEGKTGLDRDYALAWSYGVSESLTFLVPNVYGGSSTMALSESSNTFETMRKQGVPKQQALNYIERLPLYWGAQPFTSGPVYFGVIILFFFILGLFVMKGPMRWWILTGVLLSLILSWGKNFPIPTDLFLDYFPLYNKFRAVASILVIAQVLIPILALKTLYHFFYKDFTKNDLEIAKKVFYALGGICVILILFSGFFFSFQSASDKGRLPEWLIGAIESDRKMLLIKDAFRSLLLLAFSLGIIWALFLKKIKAKTAIIAIGVLVLVDLWSVDKRFLNDNTFVKESQAKAGVRPDAVDLQILQDPDIHYRVYNISTNNPFNEASTSYHHKSVGGYHAAKLRRYQDMIEGPISQGNQAVFNMLNTKYFILGGENNEKRAQPNPGALGNAWFVDSIRIVENAKEEMAGLNNFNPRSTAIVDKRFQEKLPSMDSAGISGALTLTNYYPDKMEYVSNSNAEGLAVFSETFYDGEGWKAYIDGKEAEILRANYVLRALKVPSGKHEITFEFKPRSYYMGEKISLIASLAVFLLLLSSSIIGIRRMKELS